MSNATLSAASAPAARPDPLVRDLSRATAAGTLVWEPTAIEDRYFSVGGDGRVYVLHRDLDDGGGQGPWLSVEDGFGLRLDEARSLTPEPGPLDQLYRQASESARAAYPDWFEEEVGSPIGE